MKEVKRLREIVLGWGVGWWVLGGGGGVGGCGGGVVLMGWTEITCSEGGRECKHWEEPRGIAD